MTPLSIALNLTLSFAGLAALCLSMDRHHRAIAGRSQSRARARTLRLAGWAAIAASFAASIVTSDWNFGPVQWIGSLTGAALLVVALASYRPGWISPAALATLPLAIAAALLA
jgi:hypothetical protein